MYKFDFKWTYRTKLKSFFRRAVCLYGRDTWMTGKTGVIILTPMTIDVLRKGWKVCTENLFYFQFIDNKTVTLFKMNGIPADVFLWVHERLDRLPKYFGSTFGVYGGGTKIIGYSFMSQWRCVVSLGLVSVPSQPALRLVIKALEFIAFPNCLR